MDLKKLKKLKTMFCTIYKVIETKLFQQTKLNKSNLIIQENLRKHANKI